MAPMNLFRGERQVLHKEQRKRVQYPGAYWEHIPAIAAIATPAANAYYSYKLGEIAQGLQARFSIAQDNAGAGVTVDAFAVVLMVV